MITRTGCWPRFRDFSFVRDGDAQKREACDGGRDRDGAGTNEREKGRGGTGAAERAEEPTKESESCDPETLEM